MDRLNMGWRERIFFIMVLYISPIENGETWYGIEGINLPPDIFACLPYWNWKDWIWDGGKEYLSLWLCMFLLYQMERLNMGWKKRFSFIMVLYISLIDNGDTEYWMEGKNLSPYIFVCLSSWNWGDWIWNGGKESLSLWFCRSLLQKIERLNMGWRERISLLIYTYVSLL